MLPILAPMAIGAVGGALMNKKKPLNGALLGAGLGAGAGAAFPAMGGLLGGSVAPAATAASPAAAVPAAAPSTGLLSSANAALTEYKPMIDAASIGLQASGAMDQQPQMQAPQVQQAQGGSQVMAGLASQGGSAKLQSDAAERERRKQMIRGYS